MIIGVCGYGFTGSGAVLDILKGFSQFDVVDGFEFSFVYKPDGIESLEHFLVDAPSRYFGCDTAIRRFIKYCKRMKRHYDKNSNGMFTKLSGDYISSLIQTTWKGTCSFHSIECGAITYYIKYRLLMRLRTQFEKRIKVINGSHYPDIPMYLSIQPEDFLDKTKAFIRELVLSTMSDRDKIPVLDQPFSADNPMKSFKYFDEPYAIIIDKDPRDLYILAKKALGIRGRFIPTDSVDSFIDYYKAIMTYSAKTNEMSPNILHIHFEDLIYDTDHSIARIKSFLGISGDMDKKTEFYPEKSINNTQLFRRYPEYGRDIERIEQELACWLYDFSRFDMTPTFNGIQF